ncbi:unnamed protein product, partial [Didymodactylos carnosus]
VLVMLSLMSNIAPTSICDIGGCICIPNRYTAETIYCKGAELTTLVDLEFPATVQTLSLTDSSLTFDTVADIQKIQNMTNLKFLTLSNNPLTKIPLFNHTNIQSLIINEAQINSVQFPDTYCGLSSLDKISLSSNIIETINDDDFKSLKNSKVTDLEINKNRLSKINPNAFIPLSTSLQSLSLSGNNLVSCEFLSILGQLATINLNQNQFTSLPSQLFAPHNIKSYSFIENLIETIDETSPLNAWAKQNLSNTKIYLNGNPFDCCQSLWFIRYLKRDNKQYVVDAEELNCNAPRQYAGKRLLDLNPDLMTDCTTGSKLSIANIIFIVLGSLLLIIVIIVIIIVIISQIRKRQRKNLVHYETLPAAVEHGERQSSRRPSKTLLGPDASLNNPRSLTTQTNYGTVNANPEYSSEQHTSDMERNLNLDE